MTTLRYDTYYDGAGGLGPALDEMGWAERSLAWLGGALDNQANWLTAVFGLNAQPALLMVLGTGLFVYGSRMAISSMRDRRDATNLMNYADAINIP